MVRDYKYDPNVYKSTDGYYLSAEPSQPNVQQSLAQKLMNENIRVGQRRIKTTEQQFNQSLPVIFNIMNASKKGSALKKN